MSHHIPRDNYKVNCLPSWFALTYSVTNEDCFELLKKSNYTMKQKQNININVWHVNVVYKFSEAIPMAARSKA
jgi:hypothetical protein